jgi:preprotein translocase SecE subunit
MAFGLYKPGQGYWMRVVTASVVGAMVLATAMWVASEAKRVALNLPVRTYTLTIRDAVGAPTAGSTVTLFGAATQDGQAETIGTAAISSYDTASGTLVVSKPEITSKKSSAYQVQSVRVDAAGGSGFRADVASPPVGQVMIEPLYLQGISASVVLILGAIITYWFCAVKPKSVDFLIATDMEMKKVNWSTRKDIIASTYVVIGAAFLIAALIFSVDALLREFFHAIGVLKA